MARAAAPIAALINAQTLARPHIRSNYSSSSFPAVADSQESRRLARLNALSGSTFGAGETIRFNIPAGTDEVLDGVNSYIVFYLEVTQETADDEFVLKECGGIGAFERVTVRNNATTLEDLQHFPHLSHYLALSAAVQSKQELVLSTGQFASYGRDTRRIMNGLVRVLWPMSEISILNTYQYLPLMLMSNTGNALELTLEVASPNRFVWQKSGTGTITVNIKGIEMYMELVRMSKDWVRGGWQHLIKQLNVELPTVMWTAQQQSVTTATYQTVQFTNNSLSVKSMHAVIKKTDRVHKLTGDEYLEWYLELPILSYVYRMNSDLYPQEPIKIYENSQYMGVTRVVAEYLKCFRLFGDYSYTPILVGDQVSNEHRMITNGGKPGKQFPLPLVLDTHILGEEDNIISGLNLMPKAAPLEVDLQFQAAPSASTMYLIVQADAKLIISDSGVVMMK